MHRSSDHDVVALKFIKEESTKHSIEEMQDDARKMRETTRGETWAGACPDGPEVELEKLAFFSVLGSIINGT